MNRCNRKCRKRIKITRNPVSHVHNVSLTGSTRRTSYIANVNYASRQGIVKKSGFETFRGRIEVTQRLFNDKVKLRFGLLGRSDRRNATTTGGAYSQATRRNPTEPVKNEDGTWYENLSKFEYENPVALIEESEGNYKNTQLRYNLSLVYNPIRDLTLQANYSYNRNNQTHGYGETHNHISAKRDGRDGWAQVDAGIWIEKLFEITAQYNAIFNQNKLTVLLGYSYNEK